MTRMCCVPCDRNTWCDILIGLYQVQRFVGAYVRRLWKLTNSFSISNSTVNLQFARYSLVTSIDQSTSERSVQTATGSTCCLLLVIVTVYIVMIYCTQFPLTDSTNRCLMWTALVQSGISVLCWHVHWRVIILLNKRSLKMVENRDQTHSQF